MTLRAFSSYVHAAWRMHTRISRYRPLGGDDCRLDDTGRDSHSSPGGWRLYSNSFSCTDAQSYRSRLIWAILRAYGFGALWPPISGSPAQVCGAIGAAGGISPRKAVARLGPIHGSLVPFTGPLVPFLRVRTREMASSKQSPFPSRRRASQIPRAATEPSKSASFVESVHTSSAE